VLPNAMDTSAGVLPPLDVRPIEQATTLEIKQHSWLLMRVNDGVGDLGDNRGEYAVTIEPNR